MMYPLKYIRCHRCGEIYELKTDFCKVCGTVLDYSNRNITNICQLAVIPLIQFAKDILVD
jgi:hypothetical protein